MSEQELLFEEEPFACDGCDLPGTGPGSQEPPAGWLVIGRGFVCSRRKGARESEAIELHYCPACQRLGPMDRLRRRLRLLGSDDADRKQ